VHLKHGYCMLIHFIHGYYCIYRPWQHIYTLRTTVYHSFTSALLRYARYARVYWLAEFGDVSCLQFNYLRVETLTPTWEDFVGQFGRTIWSDNLVGHLSNNFKSEVRQNSVSDLSVWSLIYLEGSVYEACDQISDFCHQ
jgi:hypothetical protein